MRALAGFIMQARSRAVMVTAASAVLALMLPPFAYLSGGAVSLVTLRQGARDGIRIVAWSTLAMAILGYLLLRNPSPAIGFALVIWLPVWLVSTVLRETVSLSLAAQAAAAMGMLAVVGVYLVVGDPAPVWREALERVLLPMLDTSGFEAGGTDVQTVLGQIAELMTGAMAAMMVITVLLSLALGRWWQAVLYNPGGFGTEFRGLRCHRGLALVAGGLIAVAMGVTGLAGRFAADLALPLFLLFGLQGLAVAHSVVYRRGLNRGWLIGMYLVMAFLPGHAVLVLGIAGVVDSFVDFRARLPAGTSGDD